MEKILLASRFSRRTLEPLRQKYSLLEAWQDPEAFVRQHSARDTIRVLATLGTSPVSSALMSKLPNLSYICNYGAGVDNIDLDAARERQILVTNTPGASASSVAELAMMLLLASIRQLPYGDQAVRDGTWASRGTPFMVTDSLEGRRLGIYGLGYVGAGVARRAEAFQMSVGYVGRSCSSARYRRFETLPELAGWADDLVIAASANPSTVRSVDRAVLSALGPKGYLINVARGSIVEEDALVEALAMNGIAGAGLDVFESEPEIRAEFLSLPNVVLSPHRAGSTKQTLARTDMMFRDNIERYFAGHAPLHVVT